ncbi:fumarylacetoacetate hydrolase family protein [Salibacterium halotolerans]|uniref:2-keto-4-pentenoate hydratase/2-oxohepta-3-ene-1,7-dioic acid hydratase (Catechol pathway) n=1 Tax=Salibacterium halotolerans TaxID=1884432 RepID=A0A1I5T6W1_9BACI|nr:fumarylacetoacetate hydrolase family protein [Salibacterium halotolerans]SFP78387.1 2-keto-4-pentenoate hydratase/2-oxohepta-3-ene-1,7-dioic acid hydratase (catechol pathway) [Salibacterium halotolerans]
MKTATVKIHEKETVAVITDDEQVVDITAAALKSASAYQVPDSMIQAAADGERFWEEAGRLTEWVLDNNHSDCLYPLEEVTLCAPVPVPHKNIMCAGKNYKDHAVEMGSETDIPDDPIIFTKAPTTVIGPGEEINPHPDVTNEVDYEGEIAVIIGKGGTGIPKEQAADHVFGYTLANDVTARDLQKRHNQFFLGKSMDTFCPMGPWIVNQEDIEGKDVKLETYVNGERRQQAAMSQMIFSVYDLIEIISRAITLQPGDIIATGTPAGVGKAFDPPRLLQPGDEVVVTADGIGRLTNLVK